jgi:galactokinase
MKSVANVLGKDVLREVPEELLFEKIGEIREKTGDRALLRALHFMQENKRVQAEVSALRSGDFERFLHLVKESGDSSYKYLQNVYMNSDVEHQNVSLALAVSEMFLGDNGVCRVHGGGFAGTIQAFVKNEVAESYCEKMNGLFGEGDCGMYKIRKCGGTMLNLSKNL